jgi:pyridoxal phosphate enzyme (YggS family)
MKTIQERIEALRQRIVIAARNAGRNERDIELLAVSKTRDLQAINQAIAAKLCAFGENYVQEAVAKIEQVEHRPIAWHFIGALQTNKTRIVAERFDWVHSVDRVKIAQRLSSQRDPALGRLNICLQVNIDSQSSKAGFSPDAVGDSVKRVLDLPQIRLRGLMAIPAPRDSETAQRSVFARVRALQQEINSGLDNRQKLDTLSMGMSADLEAAIHEGATIVRIGTDIFGPRTRHTE